MSRCIWSYSSRRMTFLDWANRNLAKKRRDLDISFSPVDKVTTQRLRLTNHQILSVDCGCTAACILGLLLVKFGSAAVLVHSTAGLHSLSIHVLDVGALLVLCELDLERYALMDGMYMAAGISGRRMKGYSKKSMSSSRRMSGWASGNVRIFRKSVKDNQD